VHYLRSNSHLLSRQDIQKKKKIGNTPFKASTNWRRFQTDEGQETQEQNARLLKDTQRLWQKVTPLLHPRDTMPLKQHFLRQPNAPPRTNMASNLTYDSKHHQLQTPYHHRNQLNR